MSIHLEITWDNPNSRLLSGGAGGNGLGIGSVGLLIDGKPQPPASSSAGKREYDLTDAQLNSLKTIRVVGRFSMATDAVQVGSKTVGSMVESVLDVSQDYSPINNNTELKELAQSPFSGAHPLVTTASVKGAKRPTVRVHVSTNFVDVTPFWSAYAQWFDWFTADKPTDVSFLAIAYTGDPARDWIWFACVPKQSQSVAEVSSWIHYQYEGYRYTRIDQSHDMFEVNRHMLTPLATAPAKEFWRRQVFTRQRPDTGKPWFFLRGGFMQSLIDCGKNVLLLYPLPVGKVPEPQTAFGPAQTAKLPALVEQAFRLLHAKQLIGVGQAKVARQKLAVSGYSAGGIGMWEAVIANISAKNKSTSIDEIYAMDAVLTSGKLPFVQQWIKLASDPRLRMTGWLQRDANEVIFDAVAQKLGSKVTLWPPKGQKTSIWDPGGSDWWDAMLGEFTAAKDASGRVDETARHQFGFQGGSGKRNTDPFILEFLKASGL